MRNLLRWEDKVFWVDLTGMKTGDGSVVDLVNPDGSRRPATGKDVSLFDLLKDGKVIGDEPPALPV